MRHQKAFRKLGRTSAHRQALMRNLVTSLLDQEQIQTTDAKAKELRQVADRMISLAKDGGLHARRQALSFVRSKSVVHKLFTELKERYAARPGGYTRVYKVGYRRGDGAPISVVALVSEEAKKPSRRRRLRKKAAQAEGQPAQAPAKTEAPAEAAPAAEAAAPKKAPARKAKPKAKEAAAEPAGEAAEEKKAD